MSPRTPMAKSLALAAAHPGLALLALLFWLPTLMIIQTSVGLENNHDEHLWHLPAIRQIASHWPSIDVVNDSLSASPPGYHWVLAGLSRLTGASLESLRLWNALISFALITSIYAWLTRSMSSLDAALLTAPLATSNFIVKSSAWILTDNAGLLCATGTLLALFVSPGKNHSAAASLLATFSILIRQINAWILAPLFIAPLIFKRHLPTQSWMFAGLKSFALIVIPLLVLSWLFVEWQGLVPPQWRSQNVGLSTCPQAYLLALAAIILPFYLPQGSLMPAHLYRERWWLTIGASSGLLVALLTPTSPSYETGRWGGYLWSLAERMPVIADRSLFFLLLAPVGGALIILLFRDLICAKKPHQALLWLASITAWSASLLVSRQVFHRYFEPTLLIFAIIGLGLFLSQPLSKQQRIRLFTLTLIQIALTLATTCLKL